MKNKKIISIITILFVLIFTGCNNSLTSINVSSTQNEDTEYEILKQLVLYEIPETCELLNNYSVINGELVFNNELEKESKGIKVSQTVKYINTYIKKYKHLNVSIILNNVKNKIQEDYNFYVCVDDNTYKSSSLWLYTKPVIEKDFLCYDVKVAMENDNFNTNLIKDFEESVAELKQIEKYYV